MAEPWTPPAGLRRGATHDEVVTRADGTRAVLRLIMFEDATGAPLSVVRVVTDLPAPLAGCCWSCGMSVTNCRSFDPCCADCCH